MRIAQPGSWHYLWHDWLLVLVDDVAKGHLCAFVVVEAQLGEVDIGYLIEGG